jgi:hypothetical protein
MFKTATRVVRSRRPRACAGGRQRIRGRRQSQGEEGANKRTSKQTRIPCCKKRTKNICAAKCSLTLNHE